MNYIIHLNAFMEKAAKEDWLVPYHYSLYMSLFNTWNKLGFRKEFSIHRENTMKAAKLTSKTTYYKAIKQLEAGNYLVFYPSQSRFVQARVLMIPLWKVQVPETLNENLSSGNLQVPPKGLLQQTNIKLISNEVSNGLPSMDDVVKFAIMHQYNAEEAVKFWYHQEATGWVVGNTTVQHWQPLMHKWMLNLRSNQSNNDKDPDYNEPF